MPSLIVARTTPLGDRDVVVHPELPHERLPWCRLAAQVSPPGGETFVREAHVEWVRLAPKGEAQVLVFRGLSPDAIPPGSRIDLRPGHGL